MFDKSVIKMTIESSKGLKSTAGNPDGKPVKKLVDKAINTNLEKTVHFEEDIPGNSLSVENKQMKA